jgi:hypothetical protein
MYNEEQLDEFFAKVYKQLSPEYNAYKDPEFCNALQIHALRSIHLILFVLSIKSIQQKNNHAEQKPLDLILHAKHPLTGLTCFDYCVIAGLEDMSFCFASIGANKSPDISTFKSNLQQNYHEQPPALVQKIFSILDKLPPNLENSSIDLRPEATGMRAMLSNYINTERKYPFMLMIVGLILIITGASYGTATGLAAILLFSFGLPSFLASFKEMRTASTAVQNRELIKDQEHIGDSAKHIDKLMHLTAEEEHKITDRIKGLQAAAKHTTTEATALHMDTNKALLRMHKHETQTSDEETTRIKHFKTCDF